LFYVFKFGRRRWFLFTAIWKILGAHYGENWLASVCFLVISCGTVFRFWRFIDHWHQVQLFIHHITVKLTLFFGLLLFPNFCSLFQVLHYHLTIGLLSLICFLSFFILLIPAPFIYLRLGQTTCKAYSLTSFFAPGWVFLVFLHQILHLVWIFPISFLFVGLAREILHLITGDLLLNLWSSVEGSTRWVQVLSIYKRLLIRKELTNFLLLSCFT